MEFIKPTSELLFTYELGDLALRPQGAASVVVDVRDVAGGAIILSITYSTADVYDVLRIYSIADEVETYMREAGKCFIELEVSAETDKGYYDSIIIGVLYCERPIIPAISAQVFAAEHFLAPRSYKRVPMQSAHTLRYKPQSATESRDCALRVHFVDGDGDAQLTTIARRAYDSRGVRAVSVVIPDLAAEVAENTEAGLSAILSVCVCAGAREYTYYIDDYLPAMCLCYVNHFGAEEVIGLTGKTTEKLQTELDTVVVAGRLVTCNRSVTLEYDTEVEALLPDEAREVADMCASPRIARLNSLIDMEDGNMDDFPAIIVTDYEADVTAADDALSSVKITWQYDRGRAAEADYSGGDHRFTDEYNGCYD
ncbi:MAG: hypothetical protein ACI30K_01595 [Muribaculaceae bacterium]